MGHNELYKGHITQKQNVSINAKHTNSEDFVLEKSIFNNIFEKDIRRIFIYKKAERLAKALHLIAPAFSDSVSLKNRIDAIAVGLIDAAVLPLGVARTALSRELLTLSSVLGVARTGGLLSPMNTELISHEAHILLQEVADYEEPRLFLDEVPTLSNIAKNVQKKEALKSQPVAEIKRHVPSQRVPTIAPATLDKGQKKVVKDKPKGQIKDRQEAVLSVIKNKGSVSIKDISTMIHGVSEKTIQRELTSLIESGLVEKKGQRRWSTYSLA